MVDWERVQELRSRGRDWNDIANDPKVDFHPDASAGSPGRALRALYQRTGRGNVPASAPHPPKGVRKGEGERKWTLTRVGYLLTAAVGVWFVLAYLAPSPVGVLVPAIPYLGLGLAGSAFVLTYALWRRTEGRRWTSVYRTTVVLGIVVGLALSGAIALTSVVVYGCPYLPPSSSLSGMAAPGWSSVPVSPWQADGRPVVFFYGATWCPFCSASSWAIYKALTEYAAVTGVRGADSSTTDIGAGTPEVVLADLQLGSRSGNGPGLDLQAAEDTSGVRGTLPATSSCFQQAYVSAYSQGIPFLVVNGQYVHLGTFVRPALLGPWSLENNSANGFSDVLTSVNGERPVTGGNPWSAVESSAWWITAVIAKSLGYTSSTLGSLQAEYGWNTTTTNAVGADLGSLT